MIRTQIQLPERLYEEAKRLAREKEVSLTEVVRRGLELLLTIYPTDRAEKKGVDIGSAGKYRIADRSVRESRLAV